MAILDFVTIVKNLNKQGIYEIYPKFIIRIVLI